MTDPSTPRVCRAPHPEHPHLSCLLYAPHGGDHRRDWDGDRWVNLTWSDTVTETVNTCRYCKEQYDPDIGPDFCSFVCDVASTVEANIVSFLRFEFEKQKAEAVAADTINLTDWEDAADALERGDHRR